ncbi:transcriptional regulator DEF1 [Oryza sativa Japonica Group]|jgi:hypothetical protein|uniref:Os03g0587600 protein n=2 Tax=Oryza sativa subsp. japonica TaxID=39947 RepID=Q5W6L7_ORYSJ|nr:trithorax group protein osa [Oryza sativa Japonica Group]AAV35795.1 zinc knuckle containing protein [Oryza sativa Japonica Group]ABF97363.1 Zinc knuckle family protein [Oryza sativa Japonica Group]EAZ27640.1 hypothetical protein OsJ_11584 [Oryza sativa Japonica Group]KAF2940075.1 hypothetical protein DAI22_03g243300 [Oryza sativa Japonica Group]BAH92241.1 Os03g0587600 [Oryza sativa Japonica Group]|eukprot:NP_001173513.1 Os03g0587600 [Oryza sativa Japonica Group]
MEIMQQLAAAATATATATATPLCLPEPPPTAMTTAQVEAAIATLHGKKQGLREAYDSLVLHSPIPLPFRWSDLDSHLSSLQSSIHARFSQLQALQASRPAPPAAAAASHDEDVEMEDVQEQGEDEVMAPPSTVQVKEEPVEAAACASNTAGERAGVGQDGFVRPGGMAAAKMASPSKVQVKEEPVEVSPSPPAGATGLTAAACASMDAPRLTDVCKRAGGGGGQGLCARNGSGTAQSPPIPSCPVLQQQHTAGAPNGSHPVLRQHAANAMNAGHSAAFRPQQHMGKPRDTCDLRKAAAPNTGDRLPLQWRQQRVHANLTCPLPPPVVAGSSSSPPQQRVGVFPSPTPQIVGSSPPPPSQARVGEANVTNPSRQQFTASAPHAGDGQLQKRPPWQRLQRVGVANPMNAGDLPPQKPHFTANARNAGEHPFQEQQQPPPVAKPTDAAAGDLLPQQKQLMANAPNAGEHLLPEQQKQQPVTAAKPANAPPLQHAANATNPAVLRRQRQRQWVRLRPPTATNLPQTKQEQHHLFMADDGANARNPLSPPPPCGMAKPPNSGDPLTDQNNQQLMANTHSAPTPVSTPLVASNQSESSAMTTTTTTNSNQNSGGGRTGPQPVAAGAAPNPAGNQQQGQRKGGANRRGGRGQGNKNNNVANTNISNMSKVIGKGNKGQGNGNPQLNKNGNPQFNKNVPGDHHQKNKNAGQLCYRCGCRGHWSRICRTPEHLVKLYQQDRKAKLQAGANTNTVYVGAMTD